MIRINFCKKSQIAIEYVILIGLAIFISMVLVVIMYQINQDKTLEKIDVKMEDFGVSIQSELILASQMNIGYSRNIYLYDTIENTNYTISLQNNNIIILYNGLSRYYRIPLVNGNMTKGLNTLRTVNGVVYLNS